MNRNLLNCYSNGEFHEKLLFVGSFSTFLVLLLASKSNYSETQIIIGTYQVSNFVTDKISVKYVRRSEEMNHAKINGHIRYFQEFKIYEFTNFFNKEGFFFIHLNVNNTSETSN